MYWTVGEPWYESWPLARDGNNGWLYKSAETINTTDVTRFTACCCFNYHALLDEFFLRVLSMCKDRALHALVNVGEHLFLLYFFANMGFRPSHLQNFCKHATPVRGRDFEIFKRVGKAFLSWPVSWTWLLQLREFALHLNFAIIQPEELLLVPTFIRRTMQHGGLLSPGACGLNWPREISNVLHICWLTNQRTSPCLYLPALCSQILVIYVRYVCCLTPEITPMISNISW